MQLQSWEFQDKLQAYHYRAKHFKYLPYWNLNFFSLHFGWVKVRKCAYFDVLVNSGAEVCLFWSVSWACCVLCGRGMCLLSPSPLCYILLILIAPFLIYLYQINSYKRLQLWHYLDKVIFYFIEVILFQEVISPSLARKIVVGNLAWISTTTQQ